MLGKLKRPAKQTCASLSEIEVVDILSTGSLTEKAINKSIKFDTPVRRTSTRLTKIHTSSDCDVDPIQGIISENDFEEDSENDTEIIVRCITSSDDTESDCDEKKLKKTF